MDSEPSSKKQKTSDTQNSVTFDDSVNANITIGPTQDNELHTDDNNRSRTPRKLIIGSADSRYTLSQPVIPTANSQTPFLQHPSASRGFENKFYSQSPPRSPNRSPVRSPTKSLKLIELSPVKNHRMELQKIYDQQQAQKNKGRLIIDKLVLHDFKSYAGTQVIGPFHANFSAVVGPNGSGKSNVIDSMLFVFGFRANKMRQGRLRDLIHKSEDFPNLPSCSVEVHFKYIIDAIDGSTKPDESKNNLVIMRKAFRNNSSKYYINSRESTFTEVTTRLKSESIDLDHKRFLVLQGEVENIAQMKPKAEKESDDGLLEYLEDIIGTTEYKQQIEDGLQKIENLNDICIEKNDRFSIVEKEKNSLEKNKDSALEFIVKERELAVLQSQKLQYNVFKKNKKLSKVSDDLSEAQANYDTEKEKNEATLKELDESNENRDKLMIKNEDLEKQLECYAVKTQKLTAEKVANEENLKNLESKKAKTEKLIKTTEISIKNKKSNLEKLNNELAETIEEHTVLTESLQLEKDKLESIKLTLKDKTSKFSEEVETIEKELEPWKEQLQDKKNQIQLAESEIDLINEKLAKLKGNVDSTEEHIIEKNKLIVEKTEKLSKYEDELASIKSEVKVGDVECANATEKIKEMRSILDADRQKAYDARSALSNVQNRNSVLTALFKLQKENKIKGFHGRLGDLGVINEKYDIAISTASPRLDDLVVDTVECGQQCIEYLRKNRLGYARFILLDKLRKFNLNRINTPENVPRLFDLIKSSDPKFLPAFYSVMKDTLVTKDLSHANRVAYGKKRYRVVTLDGKLIDISGAMTGGGNRVSKGIMRLEGSTSGAKFDNFTVEEVGKIEEELSIREKNFKVAYDTLKEMNESLQALKDKISDRELSISQLKVELDFLNKEIEVDTNKLGEQKLIFERSQSDTEKINEKKLGLGSLQKEYEAIEDQMKSKKLRIKKLKQDIMDSGGSDLQNQNMQVASLNKKIKALVIRQKNNKSGIKKDEHVLKKLEQELSTAKSDFQNSLEGINSFHVEAANIQNTLDDNEEIRNTIRDAITENNKTFEEMKEKIGSLQSFSRSFRSKEIEMQDKLKNLGSVVKNLQKQIKQENENLNKLKFRVLPFKLEEFDKPESLEITSITEDTVVKKIQDSHNGLEDMEIDIEPDLASEGPPILAEDEINALDIEELDSKIDNINAYIENTTINLNVLEEYLKRTEEYKIRKNELDKSIDEKEKAVSFTESLKKKRLEKFMEGFGIISLTLKEMYQMITMGGNAELELVDSLDPFSEGVTFSVMPPKKSWRNISNLSGGEKTLSSLALVFALHKYKPTPLYIMDEIDAALDFRNVSIVANYIKERTKDAQLIVISLRNNMFELAKQLIGIYKCDNKTQSVTMMNSEMHSSNKCQ